MFVGFGDVAAFAARADVEADVVFLAGEVDGPHIHFATAGISRVIRPVAQHAVANPGLESGRGFDDGVVQGLDFGSARLSQCGDVRSRCLDMGWGLHARIQAELPSDFNAKRDNVRAQAGKLLEFPVPLSVHEDPEGGLVIFFPHALFAVAGEDAGAGVVLGELDFIHAEIIGSQLAQRDQQPDHAPRDLRLAIVLGRIRIDDLPERGEVVFADGPDAVGITLLDGLLMLRLGATGKEQC